MEVKLIFKNKEFKIPGQFKSLPFINEKIFSDLFFSEYKQYTVQSNDDEEIFKKFIDYLVYEKEPEIGIANYYDYFLLSQEFKLMGELLNKKIKEFNEYETNIYILTHSTQQDTSSIENNISEHLDDYIEKYGDQLININIQHLINIFSQGRETLTKQNEAYELIIKQYESKGDDNILLLLEFLDSTKLNDKNFKDNFMQQESRYGFMCHISMPYFEKIKEDVNLLKKQEYKANKMIEEQKEETQKKFEEQNSLINQLEDRIKCQDSIISSLSETIQRQNDRIASLESKLEQQSKAQQSSNEEMKKIFENSDKEISESLNKKLDELKGNMSKQNENISRLTTQVNRIELIDQKSKQNEEEFSSVKEKISWKLNGKKFPYAGNNEFKGIISYLKTQTDDIFKLVDITSSSIFNNKQEYLPKNAILYQNPKSEFCTRDVTNSWIQFDFKEYRVVPTNYTIRSYNNNTNSCHPKSWVIEGSENGDKFDVISEEKENSFLNGINLVHTFSIPNSCNIRCKYIRMRLTGPNWSNSKYLNFNCIEFYGVII